MTPIAKCCTESHEYPGDVTPIPKRPLNFMRVRAQDGPDRRAREEACSTWLKLAFPHHLESMQDTCGAPPHPRLAGPSPEKQIPLFAPRREAAFPSASRECSTFVAHASVRHCCSSKRLPFESPKNSTPGLRLQARPLKVLNHWQSLRTITNVDGPLKGQARSSPSSRRCFQRCNERLSMRGKKWHFLGPWTRDRGSSLWELAFWPKVGDAESGS